MNGQGTEKFYKDLCRRLKCTRASCLSFCRLSRSQNTVCRIRIQESEDGRVRYHGSIVYIISSTCQRIQIALQIMEESRGSDTACSRPRSPTSHCSLASVPVPGKNRRAEQEDSITRGAGDATAAPSVCPAWSMH